MNREQNLFRIRTEHAKLEAAFSRLTPAQMLLPGACGTWSAKDLLGHFVFWEQHMLEDFARLKRGEPLHEIKNEEVNPLNDNAYQRYKDWSLEDLRAEFDRSYRAIVAWLETVPEEDLALPYLYNLSVGEFIEMDTWGHYAEHMPGLEKFIEE